jgi:hypothetical protein
LKTQEQVNAWIEENKKELQGIEEAVYNYLANNTDLGELILAHSKISQIIEARIEKEMNKEEIER